MRVTVFFIIILTVGALFVTLGCNNFTVSTTTTTINTKIETIIDASGDKELGYSVGLSGDYIVASGNYNCFVSVYHCSNDNWIRETTLDVTGSCAVSISGDNIIVGNAEYREDISSDFTGVAYIYHRSDTNWNKQSTLFAHDKKDCDFFGCSVDIDGSLAIVGASGKDKTSDDIGAAYIYRYDGSNWNEDTTLYASDGKYKDYFGYSVGISGNYAAVSAPYNDTKAGNAGAVYVFHYDGSSWIEEYIIYASDAQYGNQFGHAISIDNDNIIVGNHYEDYVYNTRSMGSAYTYHRNGTSWINETILQASEPQWKDASFGYAVTISGDYAVVGANLMDLCNNRLAYHSCISDAGAIFLFHFDGTIWKEDAFLFASDMGDSDSFGYSVAINDKYIVAGAPHKTGGAIYIYK